MKNGQKYGSAQNAGRYSEKLTVTHEIHVVADIKNSVGCVMTLTNAGEASTVPIFKAAEELRRLRDG